MSIVDHAKSEMALAGFEQSQIDTMEKILHLFFDEWDSGGAVWAMQPVLNRCIAGKPLSPLTGDDSEWMEVGTSEGAPVLQNVRCGTVFKQMRNGAVEAYDIDVRGRPAITFPYDPENSNVSSPVIEVGVA